MREHENMFPDTLEELVDIISVEITFFPKSLFRNHLLIPKSPFFYTKITFFFSLTKITFFSLKITFFMLKSPFKILITFESFSDQ